MDKKSNHWAGPISAELMETSTSREKEKHKNWPAKQKYKQSHIKCLHKHQKNPANTKFQLKNLSKKS